MFFCGDFGCFTGDWVPPISRLPELYIKLILPDLKKPTPFERYVTRKLKDGPRREE
jgi:hypothetical protein